MQLPSYGTYCGMLLVVVVSYFFVKSIDKFQTTFEDGTPPEPWLPYEIVIQNTTKIILLTDFNNFSKDDTKPKFRSDIQKTTAAPKIEQELTTTPIFEASSATSTLEPVPVPIDSTPSTPPEWSDFEKCAQLNFKSKVFDAFNIS